MKLFYVEITKTIVVPMEAETALEAMELAESEEQDSGFDGAFDRAELQMKVIQEESIEHA